MLGYRIVEIKNNKVMSLFHGTNGSRQIPLNMWHKANIKDVSDGSKGKNYKSGWHFLLTLDETINFFTRMFRVKDNRYIVQCHVRKNIRQKTNSTKGKCLLADEIMITNEQVSKAISWEDIEMKGD